MGHQSDRSQMRLAELVAALSLGIDLGFGQPMEHVLRQCLIALRLAERVGLDDQGRAAVYYTALLINVGCHSDAHEQAKWFGDDIALKSGKYDHEPFSLREAAGMLRRLGAGEPAPASGSDGARVRARWAPRGRPHDRSTRQPGADVGRAARVAGGGTRRAGWVLRALGRAGAGREKRRARPSRSPLGSRSWRSFSRLHTGREGWTPLGR